MSYRCIMADPPWKYNDRLRMEPGIKRSAEDVYKTVMTTDEICALANGDDVRGPIRIMGQPIADDAVLGLWTTNPFLLNGDALRVCAAWGFTPKQLFTWVKGGVEEDSIIGALGMGHYFRVDTEHLILATRGRPQVLRHDLRNYVFAIEKGEHSAKPDEVAVMLETLTPGPYLELFARKPREGWDVVGDEVDKRDTMIVEGM